jgi:thiamine phosphate synthase YjbQ (UPF0047 family)
MREFIGSVNMPAAIENGTKTAYTSIAITPDERLTMGPWDALWFFDLDTR